jgi:hypothetical protein
MMKRKYPNDTSKRTSSDSDDIQGSGGYLLKMTHENVLIAHKPVAQT